MYNSNAFSVFKSCAPVTTIKFRIFSLLQKETLHPLALTSQLPTPIQF